MTKKVSKKAATKKTTSQPAKATQAAADQKDQGNTESNNGPAKSADKKPAVTSKTKVTALKIVSLSGERFCRAGYFFGRDPVVLIKKDLKPAQLKALLDESNIVIEEIKV